MIASVRGRVLAVSLSTAVVEVGGVGLELRCTPDTLASLHRGTEATLATSLVVREDSLTLFAFATDGEKELFELLQTASGVGAKTALAMLACMRPDQLRTAIATDDTKALTRVPGIGLKGAQRIILELKDRVGPAHFVEATPVADPWESQVREGLLGLGWSVREAEKALDAVRDEAGPVPDVATMLRAALRALNKA